MANGYKEVLFSRGVGQSDDSDIWDDTALIKAYDKAVASFKNALKGEDYGGSGPVKDEKLGKKRKTNKKNRNSKRSNTLPEREWQVGDACCAFWSEDGNLYPATISSIDHEKGTCRVLYTDYGNEEEQNLADLLSESHEVDGEVHKLKQKDMQSSTDESDRSSQPQPRHQHRSKPRHRAAPEPSMWGFGLPHGPPLGPGFKKGEARFNSSASRFPAWPPMIPPGPPMIPPPPPISPDTLEDDEALSSMLISWYMSGYHTGYYLGLRQSRKEASSGNGSQCQ